MSEDVLVSVRGEARRMVAPDYASLHGRLTGFAGSSGEALALVRAAQDGVTTALGRLGGTALTVDTHQAPLTWSVGSIGTHDEHDFAADRTSGRVFASAELLVVVRELPLLPDVAAALGRVAALRLHGVSWHVDPANPAWPALRAEAIAAAIAKGRDYASALGGSLRRVVHVADAGLLGGDEGGRRGFDLAEPAAAMAFGGSPAVPTLDPVPQQLHAVVEARLVADVPQLG